MGLDTTYGERRGCVHILRAHAAKFILLCAAFIALAAFLSGPAGAAQRRIIVLGDSLSAGFNLPEQDAFPAQLERLLKQGGLDVAVINAGVSGDTATAGLARLEWATGDGADLVIVELGANDMLRGVDPRETEKALEAIVVSLIKRKTGVLLAGMQAAPNLGADFAARFNAIFPAIAKRHGLVLYPFFLEGVAAQPGLNLADGMHPNRDGVAVIAKRIMPYVLKALEQQTGQQK